MSPTDEGRESRPFAHLDAEKADLYRDILRVFSQAKQRFVVHLRPEDVRAEISTAVELDAVTSALESLTAWGNLHPDPDTGRVSTVADFNRARYLYQLTAEGTAAEAAIALYERTVGRHGELQAVALGDIADQLRALLVLTEQSPPDVARAHLLLLALVERFTSLADNAQVFMASLRRATDLADIELEAFLVYKERLIGYIERFIADLANTGGQIAMLARQVDERGVDDLLAAVAAREASDTAPGDEDAEVDGTEAMRAAAHRWQLRWAGLRDWFVTTDTQRPAQSRLLRSAAIGAIRQLLASLNALNDRRSGRSDRAADFRTLARWFAEADDDSAAHQLWHTAFGLGGVRHLTVSAETLDAWQRHGTPASTPWAQAAPVEISPQLRKSGSYERRGRVAQVVDRSEQRRHLTERFARESAETAAARRRLHTGGPVLLSQLAELDTGSFRLFLQLIGDALAARRPDATEVITESSDGTMRIRLRTVPEGPTVQVVTADGVLSGPEHEIEITDLASEDLASADVTT
jgi:uncharacterized protein (TIGR02677 family)